MDKFRGKRAFVTGAGKGIGRGIAIKLAELGAEVYGVSRTAEDLKSLETENPKIKTIQLDISDWNKTRKVLEELAPIHFLVNNAATLKTAPADEASPEDFDLIFNTNVKAIMNTTQIVAKGLIARKEGGVIVNVSSIAGVRPALNHLIYCSSKASVEMMTKVFALELGAYNIRVNNVNPTIVMTDMGKLSLSDPGKAAKMLIPLTPQGRYAEVHEVVNAVIYLLSNESEMINGHSLPVDGGFLAV